MHIVHREQSNEVRANCYSNM